MFAMCILPACRVRRRAGLQSTSVLSMALSSLNPLPALLPKFSLWMPWLELSWTLLPFNKLHLPLVPFPLQPAVCILLLLLFVAVVYYSARSACVLCYLFFWGTNTSRSGQAFSRPCGTDLSLCMTHCKSTKLQFNTCMMNDAADIWCSVSSLKLWVCPNIYPCTCRGIPQPCPDASKAVGPLLGQSVFLGLWTVFTVFEVPCGAWKVWL